MLRADSLAGLEALAQPLLEDAKHRRDAFLVALDRIEVAQSHELLR